MAQRRALELAGTGRKGGGKHRPTTRNDRETPRQKQYRDTWDKKWDPEKEKYVPKEKPKLKKDKDGDYVITINEWDPKKKKNVHKEVKYTTPLSEMSKKGKKKFDKAMDKAQEKTVEWGTKDFSDKKTMEIPDIVDKIPVLNKHVQSTSKVKSTEKKETKKYLKNVAESELAKAETEIASIAAENGFKDDTMIQLNDGRTMTWAEYKGIIRSDARKAITDGYIEARNKAYEAIDESDSGKLSPKEAAEQGIHMGADMVEILVPYAGTAKASLKAAEGMIKLSKGGRVISTTTKTGKAIGKESVDIIKGAAKETAKGNTDAITQAGKSILKKDRLQTVKKEILANALQDSSIGVGMDVLQGKRYVNSMTNDEIDQALGIDKNTKMSDAEKAEARKKFRRDQLQDYVTESAKMNAVFGAVVGGIAGRTSKAAKRDLLRQATDLMNKEYGNLTKLTTAEARELVNLQSVKKYADQVGGTSAFTSKDQVRLDTLMEKAKKSQVPEVAVQNYKGRMVANPDNAVERALTTPERKEYLKLQTESIARGLTDKENIRLQELDAKVKTETVMRDFDVEANIETAKLNAKNKRTTGADVSNLRDAYDRYTALGDVRQARRVKRMLDTAEKHHAQNIDDVTKVGEKITSATGRAVHIESADDFAAAYARVEPQKAASVDAKGLHGFVEVDAQGRTIAIHVNSSSSQAMKFTLGHEITHMFESLDDDYEGLAKAVKELYGEDEVLLEKDLVSQNYDEMFKNMTPEARAKAEDKEVVANLVGRIIEDDGKFMDNLMEKEPTIWARIYDYVKKLIKGSSEKDEQLSQLNARLDEAFNKLPADKQSIIKSQPESTEALFIGEISKLSPLGVSNEKKEIVKKIKSAKSKVAKAEKKFGGNAAKMTIARREIFKETGCFQGIDGKWRYEIQDRDARLTYGVKLTRKKKSTYGGNAVWFNNHGEPQFDKNAFAQIDAAFDKVHVRKNKTLSNKDKWVTKQYTVYRAFTEGVPLHELLEHKELYACCPFLKDTNLGSAPIIRLMADADYRADGVNLGALQLKNGVPTIEINGHILDPSSEVAKKNRADGLDPGDALMSTLLHEIQHYLQADAGFARGGSTSKFALTRFIPRRHDRDALEINNRMAQRNHYYTALLNEDSENARKFITELDDAVSSEALFPEGIDPIADFRAGYDAITPQMRHLAEPEKAYANAMIELLKARGVDFPSKTFEDNASALLQTEYKMAVVSEPDAFNAYEQFAGEIEAREVSKRRRLANGDVPTSEQLRASYPIRENENARFSEMYDALGNVLPPSALDRTFPERLTKNDTGLVRIANNDVSGATPQTVSTKASYSTKRRRKVRLSKEDAEVLRQQVMKINSDTGNHEHFSRGYGFTKTHYVEYDTMGGDSFNPTRKVKIDGHEEQIRKLARIIDEETGGTDRYLKQLRIDESLNNRRNAPNRYGRPSGSDDGLDSGSSRNSITSDGDRTTSPDQSESKERGNGLNVAEAESDYSPKTELSAGNNSRTQTVDEAVSSLTEMAKQRGIGAKRIEKACAEATAGMSREDRQKVLAAFKELAEAEIKGGNKKYRNLLRGVGAAVAREDDNARAQSLDTPAVREADRSVEDARREVASPDDEGVWAQYGETAPAETRPTQDVPVGTNSVKAETPEAKPEAPVKRESLVTGKPQDAIEKRIVKREKAIASAERELKAYSRKDPEYVGTEEMRHAAFLEEDLAKERATDSAIDSLREKIVELQGQKAPKAAAEQEIRATFDNLAKRLDNDQLRDLSDHFVVLSKKTAEESGLDPYRVKYVARLAGDTAETTGRKTEVDVPTTPKQEGPIPGVTRADVSAWRKKANTENADDPLLREYSEKIIKEIYGSRFVGKEVDDFTRAARKLKKKGRWTKEAAEELYDRIAHPREVGKPASKPDPDVIKKAKQSKAYNEYVEKPRDEQIKEQYPTQEELRAMMDDKTLSGYEVSKHLETLYEAGHYSQKQTREQLKKDLAAGYYEKVRRESHDQAVDRAERAVNKDWEAAYHRQINKAESETLTAYDVAERRMVLQRLESMIMEGEGDIDKLVLMHRELGMNEILTASNTGAALNAFKIMKRLTPTGRAELMLRKIDRLNAKYKDRLKGKELELTEEEYQKLLQTEDFDEAMELIGKIDERLMNEVPATLFEKFAEVRRFTMLANARTHIRNVVGNTVFWGARQISDAMEVAAYQMPGVRNRVEKLGGSVDMNKLSYRKFTREHKAELNEIFDKIYKASGSTNQYMDALTTLGHPTAIKNKYMRRILDFNYEALEKEDMLMFKPTFKKAFAQWCDNHKITDLSAMTDAQMTEAGKYAIAKAEYATFRDASALSKILTKAKADTAGKKGQTIFGTGAYRAANMAIEGHMPFIKTPVNIVRRSMDYSPVGLIRGVVKLTTVKNPELFKQGIHDMCSGMTGTGVFVFGMYLASTGHITVQAGSGLNEKSSGDAYYDRDMGFQDYSLVVGGEAPKWAKKAAGKIKDMFGLTLHNPLDNKEYSVSIDWASPMQTALFMGATLFEQKEKEGWSPDTLFDTAIKVFNPMLDMSFMQTSKETFESFTDKVYRNGTGDNADWAGAIKQTVFGRIPQGYIGSFVPQMLSQVVSGADKYQRDTRSTLEDPVAASWDSWRRQMINKIPVLRWTENNKKIDRFGRDKMNTGGDNIVMRMINATINPSNVKRITFDETDKELIKVYNDIPDEDSQKKYFWYSFTGNPDYELANGERMTYKELYDYGVAKRTNQTDEIKAMIASDSYKNMTNKMKVDEIDSYNWNAQIAADYKVYKADYALEKIVGTNGVGGVVSGPGKNKTTKTDKELGFVTDDDAVGSTSDREAWQIYSGRHGDGTEAKDSFVKFWLEKESLISRSHNTDYNTKAMACALLGGQEMARAYDVNTDKVDLANKYVEKYGKKNAKKMFTDANCNIKAGLDEEGVNSTSKANRAWSAAKYNTINEDTYRAMGFDWNSAQSGAGLRNKFGYHVNTLIAMKNDAKYEFDANESGTLQKDEVIAYIESLGKESQQEKACLFEYLKPSSNTKNPYGSIDDYLNWGENIDEEDGKGRRGRRGRGRRGGWGRGGGGGGSSGLEMPTLKGQTDVTAPSSPVVKRRATGSGAIKTSVSDPFGGRSTGFGARSNLDDAYRKRLKKLREANRKKLS